MSYWQKKSDFKENRDLKKEQFISVFNIKSNDWERIRLKDYLNNFVDEKDKKDIKNEIKQNFADVLVHEITKAQNMQNITGSTDPDEQQFKKFVKYVEQYKKEKIEEKGEK